MGVTGNAGFVGVCGGHVCMCVQRRLCLYVQNFDISMYFCSGMRRICMCYLCVRVHVWMPEAFLSVNDT